MSLALPAFSARRPMATLCHCAGTSKAVMISRRLSRSWAICSASAARGTPAGVPRCVRAIRRMRETPPLAPARWSFR
ncbi:hypothetical protein VR46_10650 [Streptomyces sp. NRRL S-444]|nr:hypothetical protein VR46_10650 [Streptomyces sp. NRRL S-444]